MFLTQVDNNKEIPPEEIVKDPIIIILSIIPKIPKIAIIFKVIKLQAIKISINNNKKRMI